MTNDLYFVNLRSLIAFLYIAVNDEDVMEDINDGIANGIDEQIELAEEELEEEEQQAATKSVETGDSDLDSESELAPPETSSPVKLQTPQKKLTEAEFRAEVLSPLRGRRASLLAEPAGPACLPNP